LGRDSREQIWDELVIMGELKTSRGYHDVFWEFSADESEAEGLGWMMEDMGVGECRGPNGIMIKGSWVLRRESWGWATCWLESMGEELEGACWEAVGKLGGTGPACRG
jgi:hypothetical protein